MLQSLPAHAVDILPAIRSTETGDARRPRLKADPLLDSEDAYAAPVRPAKGPDRPIRRRRLRAPARG